MRFAAYDKEMLQAVQAPFLKSMVVAGAAVLVGAFAVADDDTVTQRLELHAPKQCGAVYDTAWAKGDVVVEVRANEAKPLVFKQRGFHWGCAIEATEVLTPAGADRYHYAYDEKIVWCRGDAGNYVIKTPRTGYVLVVDKD